ncbi:MAG: hypothetical protein ABFR82_10725 [Nitrospirota bacterium]
MKSAKIYFNSARESGMRVLSGGVKISLLVTIFLSFLLAAFQVEAADKENCLM